jgi:hypothetical protein
MDGSDFFLWSLTASSSDAAWDSAKNFNPTVPDDTSTVLALSACFHDHIALPPAFIGFNISATKCYSSVEEINSLQRITHK